jgi:hypothetical protein
MNMRRNSAFQVPVKDLSLFRTGWPREGPAESVDGDLVRQEELSRVSLEKMGEGLRVPWGSPSDKNSDERCL